MSKLLSPTFLVVIAFCLLLGASLSGCYHKASASAKKPTLVVVDHPMKRDVVSYFETNGFADAYEYTTIVARVPGALEEIRYKPGSIVFEGDPLFLIEQDRYLANRDAAKADLAAAEAQEAQAKANLARSVQLRKTNTNTQEEHDQHVAEFKVAEAKILQAKAALRDRELDLKYTDVRAPISGKADRNLIDRGNYVGSTPENTSLTTIANMDPIYIYFSVSASQANELQKIRSEFDERTKSVLERLKTSRIAKDGAHAHPKPEPPFPEPPSDETAQHEAVSQEATPEKEDHADTKNIGVDINALRSVASSFNFENHLFSIALHKKAGEKFDYTYDGVMDLSSNRVDPRTGTIKFRGKIPNEKYVIYPGQPVQVQVPLFTDKDAVVIRDEAVCSDLNLKYVLVVDDKGVISRKNVVLGPLQNDGTRVVQRPKGVDSKNLLNHSDVYIVQGAQKVTVGQKVETQTFEEFQKKMKEKEEKREQALKEKIAKEEGTKEQPAKKPDDKKQPEKEKEQPKAPQPEEKKEDAEKPQPKPEPAQTEQHPQNEPAPQPSTEQPATPQPPAEPKTTDQQPQHDQGE